MKKILLILVLCVSTFSCHFLDFVNPSSATNECYFKYGHNPEEAAEKCGAKDRKIVDADRARIREKSAKERACYEKYGGKINIFGLCEYKKY